MSTAVLFVCLGNICRSPSAHGVFAHKVRQAGLQKLIRVDSAGTGDWHAGEPPDARSARAALARGYDLSTLRARQVNLEDFAQFDFMLAMDNNNLRELQRLRPPDFAGELGLFLDYAAVEGEREVPDPYYGEGDGFEHVLDLVEAAADGLLAHIRRTRC